MESSQKKYNVTKLEIKDDIKKDGHFISHLIKKFKPSKRKKSVFKSYGFYATLLLIITSFIGLVIIWCTDYYDKFIVEYLTIQDNSSFYKIWRDPKSDLIVRVYPFNYTNIDAVIAGKEKPKVEEIGPYVFRENSQKTNVIFNGKDSVTYSYNRTLTFLREYTNGSLNDTIITPNVVFISALDKVSKDRLQQMGLSVILAALNSKPFIRVSSYEFIMGYDDSFSIMLRRINTLLRKEVHPPFGILSKRIGLSGDRLTIGTGVHGKDNIGILEKYNDNDRLNIWDGSECNNITASDGFLFPGRTVANSDVIYVYTKDLCRRIPLKLATEFTTKEGFTARRFNLSSNVYSTPEDNPGNSCFCSKTNSCQLSGVQNVSPCFYDAPFIMSHPHFLYADKEIFDKIDGLDPNPEKHTYFMDLHKEFGFPLRGNSRVQLGIVVNKGTSLSRWKSLKNGAVLPISWMDFELPELPENINTLLYHLTFTAPMIKHILKWCFPVFLLIAAIRFVYYMSCLTDKEK